MSSTEKRSLLVLTNSEHRQANVCFAVAYELLLCAKYNIHIASYQPAREQVQWLNEQVNTVTNDAFLAIFHQIPGKSLQSTGVDDVTQAPHRPGYRVLESFDFMAQDIVRNDVSLHLQAYDGVVKLIKELSPIVAIVHFCSILGKMLVRV